MAILLASAGVLALTLPLITYGVHVPSSAHFARASDAPTLPAGWQSLGCFTDGNPGGRTLGSATFTNTTGMTVESCVAFCAGQSFIYAGVEYAQECWCGNTIANGGTNVTDTDCDSPCTGNPNETCGAGNRLNVYWSGVPPPAPPITVPSVGQWESLGCYNDSVNARVLAVGVNVLGNFTVEGCTDACFNAGYPLSGMEYATQCFCDTVFENGGAPTPLTDCNMPCAGNGSEFCGGANRLNVYNFTGTLSHGPEPPAGGGGGNPTNPVAPVTSGLPAGWTYNACWVDNAFGRIFQTELPDNQGLTVESCITSCAAQNFTLAGAEYSVQCFCGNTLINGAVKGSETDCNMGCGGDTTEACGGPNRLSVYTSTGTVTALPVPTALNSSLPGQWEYQGCLEEPGANRVFPYQNIYTNNMTIQACLNQCAAFGYPAGGAEFGDECWCGDVSDVTANSPGFAPETDCDIPCSDDPIHLCGGAERLQYYKWNGNMNNWQTPSNIGRYEFLIGGVVVPLLVTLGINNKVAFVEKWGTSEYDNSTGAYELDLSLTDDFNTAWRTMHVKTDVFCSAAVVLPDRGARHLNIGGWSLSSTYGVRLYTPDGSPGVNGTNDWEENVNELSLQRGRWYPSALVMSNGSVLVVGGGPTYLFMDWLNRTDPNNLYPFLHMLPSGRIFVGYYNEARVLDAATFGTITTLPNMPGSVTSFLAGEPTQWRAPPFCSHNMHPTLILSQYCIQPEVANPQWTLERMPSKRVMTCMAALPDGTYLIVNGAHQGVAGFGLASDPNLNALLYDPSQPVGSRISILNNTIVARLYHSEATLLPDGRVLISGSDPQTPGFPEEMRVEVYIPPYLNEGRAQPSFTVSENDWTYGGTYTIDVTLHQGTTSTMKVSMIAATSSTHGNAMGMRTIFPEFSCNGNTCTITAPPNSFISPPSWYQLFILDGPTPSTSNWIRLGGDPADLGNWPNFPDFTQPGVGPL
ncbi:putative fungistatic metabolite [Grifola frondosa]|uniref:Putative fungistatic metabolite n=1 Tax=Grifola frondosa TaxID=5627 RepID=A0A1C7M8Z1_GRIFR|nr:putative fungistatic metabolite [Grifola frondosa]